jgi:hypothetical protein
LEEGLGKLVEWRSQIISSHDADYACEPAVVGAEVGL